MNKNILIRESRCIVGPWMMVDRYDAVTPFGNKVQKVTLMSPPDMWQDRCPACCRSVNARRLTSWRVSTGKMEIVALPGYIFLSLWAFQAFIFSFLPYFFHSETVSLLSCPYQAPESLSFNQDQVSRQFLLLLLILDLGLQRAGHIR